MQPDKIDHLVHKGIQEYKVKKQDELIEEIMKEYRKTLMKLSDKKKKAYLKWIDLFMHQHKSE